MHPGVAIDIAWDGVAASQDHRCVNRLYADCDAHALLFSKINLGRSKILNTM